MTADELKQRKMSETIKHRHKEYFDGLLCWRKQPRVVMEKRIKGGDGTSIVA
jgi:hypothetical protein